MRRILLFLTVCFVLCQSAIAQGSIPDSVRHLFDYDQKAPLDIKETGTLDRNGVKVIDLTFASPKGGRVPAYLIVPPGKGPHAGIVYGHWGGGNRTEFLSEAVMLAEAGAVSVLIDYPWERSGESRRKGPDVAEPEKSIAVSAQAVIDLRRAIDLLLARSDVDPKRIGYVGHSYGAQWGAILSAVDKRMKTAVLMGGVPTSATLWLEGFDPGLVEYRNGLPKGQLDSYLKLYSQLDAIEFVPRAAPVSLFFQFARQERIMTEAHMNKYGQAASEPKAVKFYDGGHELLNPQAMLDRDEWLQKQLGLKSIMAVLEKRLRSGGTN
ncbi:MAG TPA: acetylxylan esterase [Blastocatellia bacterium]|nr:acetylxylan esterase [Blastocatellia bacterium]